MDDESISKTSRNGDQLQVRPVRLGDLAERLGGALSGDPELEISRVSGIREAVPGDLTLVSESRYLPFVASTRASAVLSAKPLADARPAVIVVDDPYQAFLDVAGWFRPETPPPAPGVDPTAVVGAGVRLGEAVSIGPCAVLGAGARVGDGAVVAAGVVVGQGAWVGPRSVLHANVTIGDLVRLGEAVVVHSGTVIGADGFGFRWDGEEHRKVPQLGGVVVEDKVEIGANCAIDRGTVGDTRIGRGARLDNLVHVGHNVQVGANTLIIAQVGIGGSTRVGRDVTLAGQVGIVGHVEIGDGAQIGAQAGVIDSVEPGAKLWGYPAMPLGQSKRVYASIKRTPELIKRLKEVEEKVEALEKSLELARTSGASSP